eukprot:9259381-Alexandrium_andersonii.AAC.1
MELSRWQARPRHRRHRIQQVLNQVGSHMLPVCSICPASGSARAAAGGLPGLLWAASLEPRADIAARSEKGKPGGHARQTQCDHWGPTDPALRAQAER